MAVQRADLFAHDHVDAELRVVVGKGTGALGAPDLVVVGDGDDVDAAGGGPDDVIGMLRAVAEDGMHVQVRASRWNAPPSSPSLPPPREQTVHRVSACTSRVTGLPFCT